MQRDDVEIGSIILWSGAIVDIPAGYVICDGNNGTPDLRNRFVVGAGDTYAKGDSGGSTSHSHSLDGLSAGTNGPNDVAPWSLENHLPPYFSLAYIMKT